MEFCGQELCEKALMDHQMILQDHSKVERLVERMMQIVKQRLCKYGLQKGRIRYWDM
jgi:hypothetical protein